MEEWYDSGVPLSLLPDSLPLFDEAHLDSQAVFLALRTVVAAGDPGLPDPGRVPDHLLLLPQGLLPVVLDVAAGLRRGVRRAHRAGSVDRPPPRRRTCFDYLMLDSKDREKADRRLQARTHGVFGSHPCDPVVSTTQERPFDTDFIEVPLIPGTASIKVPGEATGKK